MKTIKVNNCLEVPNNFTGIVEYLYGTKEWWVKGKLHREDGPAIVKSYVTYNKFPENLSAV
jgi:hypothetical protein